MTEVLQNCLSIKNKLYLFVHATLKSILVSLGSCRGWRANDSVEAKWIWIAKHLNDRCCDSIDYTTALSLGRHDAVWERRRSSSSRAGCGSGLPWAPPHSPRLERWSWTLVQRSPSIFSVLRLPLKRPRVRTGQLRNLDDDWPLQTALSFPVLLRHCRSSPSPGQVYAVVQDIVWLITLHLHPLQQKVR